MKLFVSQLATDQIMYIIDYLESNWSDRVRDNFIEKIQNCFDIIERMPLAFPVSRHKVGIRKCVVSPQVSIYYRVLDELAEIEVIAVLDNRIDFI